MLAITGASTRTRETADCDRKAAIGLQCGVVGGLTGPPDFEKEKANGPLGYLGLHSISQGFAEVCTRRNTGPFRRTLQGFDKPSARLTLQ